MNHSINRHIQLLHANLLYHQSIHHLQAGSPIHSCIQLIDHINHTLYHSNTSSATPTKSTRSISRSSTSSTYNESNPIQQSIQYESIEDDESDDNDPPGEFIQLKSYKHKQQLSTNTDPIQRKRGRKSMNESVNSTVQLIDEKFVLQLESDKFQCTQCPHMSNKKNELLTHIRSAHTHNKPYKCHYCNKSFTDSSGRSKHEKIHKQHTKFICMICDNDNTTNQNQSLYSFTYQIQLNRHYREKHPGVDIDVDDIQDTQ